MIIISNLGKLKYEEIILWESWLKKTDLSRVRKSSCSQDHHSNIQ